MMSSSKKRSSFQITSITSEPDQTPAVQSAPSLVLTILQSEASSCGRQGSSSQPTTPSLKRKYISHDALGQGAGSSSRFRVVRLAVGGASGGGRAEPYRRGRWTCTDITERPEGAGIRRVMDSMRHAHSLESLEMIGGDRHRGWVHSQDTTHLLAQPMGDGPPPPSPRPRIAPPPLRLDVDAAGRVNKHHLYSEQQSLSQTVPVLSLSSGCPSLSPARPLLARTIQP